MSTRKKEAPTLVDQIKEAIRDSGQSLSEISRASGVDVTRISRFVRGVRSIDVAAASAICGVLGYKLTKAEPPAPKKKGRTKPTDN
jgi:transcriptional regulator with XRE-family HTH domain